jgi:hypothetical protein
MRARRSLAALVLIPAVAAALAAGCGGGRAPFAAPVRVLDASDVDEVVADERGAVCVASGQIGGRRAGQLHAVRPDGTSAQLATRLDDPAHLQLAGDVVYYLTDDGVHRVARDGGAPVRLAALDHPTALALAGGELIIGLDDAIVALPPDRGARALVAPAGRVVDLAVHGEHLFWLDAAGGRVMRARLDGTEATALADAQAAPAALAIAGDTVVWITAGDTALEIEATVAAVPAAGGPVRTLHRKGYGYEALAVDGNWVYWSWGEVLSSVRRVPLGGGDAQTVASGQTDLDGVALDPGGLWVGGPDGLYRAARK